MNVQNCKYVLNMLIIFIVIDIFLKDSDLAFFAIYFYKINTLPSTCAHWIQNFFSVFNSRR